MRETPRNRRLIDMKLYLPFNGKVKLTSPFGYRTLNGTREYHPGIDIVGLDDTTVYAPCDGTIGSSTIVTNKNNKTWEWGNYIRIDTVDGYRIFMCHLASRKVSTGQKVKRGDPLGVMGNTGYSFGAHTHFEVRDSTNLSVDPTNYLRIENKAGIYKNQEEVTEVPKKNDNCPDGYATDAIKWAWDFGILKGDTNGNLKLHDTITRQDALVFLYRLYSQLYIKEEF